ncbi:helix-turn-helix domain-containing protein [Pelosinus propionicus]|uniref:DNA-binding transcriptional regulator, XRE-family HTH domain n=1 Tax=Pelosinus propionicus DSM 13327 TaxID=1123291 RepID=A0A1I4N3C0_9FIRM|nr:helix-turn-helix transcriptional regulator [Pelosinus propionicus]SFM09999.1 DNA-binding transcriptional regulator, XRE-family HTH domain [Pelosinus propionicus DSM 13327]
MSTFGKRLKELRSKKGLTQKELAPFINTTRDTLANWEVGRATPDIESVKTIADYFNVNTDFLLGRSNIDYKLTDMITPDGKEIVTQDHKNPEIAQLLRDNGIKKLQLMKGYSLDDLKRLVELGELLRNKRTGD